ncbi:MAG: 6-phospho-3-hexuloisomerase [Janthinobacterium lividum]
MESSPGTLTDSCSVLLKELQRVLTAVSPSQFTSAGEMLLAGRKLFFLGAGRSGLALEMAAMRFMHLGLQVHVVGEVTAPAIVAGDLLVLASASGTTKTVMMAAEVAKKVGAAILVITTAPQSPLAQLATGTIVLTAASKSDTGERASEQYAGSLFEQAVLLLLDALFHSLWKSGTQSAEDLLARHANLE